MFIKANKFFRRAQVFVSGITNIFLVSFSLSKQIASLSISALSAYLLILVTILYISLMISYS